MFAKQKKKKESSKYYYLLKSVSAFRADKVTPHPGAATPRQCWWYVHSHWSQMMIVLLLFLQKQNLVRFPCHDPKLHSDRFRHPPET